MVGFRKQYVLFFFIFYFLTNRFEFYGAVRPFFTVQTRGNMESILERE